MAAAAAALALSRGSRPGLIEATRQGVRSDPPPVPFLAADPQLAWSCPAEACAPDWKATGRDGVAYRLVRIEVENREAPRVLAIPEALLDRFPFPECDVVATSATGKPGQPAKSVGCPAGALSRIALVATLPAFRPAGRAKLLEQDSRTDVITMALDAAREQSGFRRGSTADRANRMDTWLTAWSAALARRGFMIERKPSLHGLQRVGPAHGLLGRDAATLSDVLFPGEGLAGASDVLMCTVEEALKDDRQLAVVLMPPRASCWHWFSIPDLGLDVRLSYDRTHLPEWRQTHEKALALVNRFALSGEPRP
ncbi:MAG: hypothetical protein U1E62_09280 [Alsobacter sp.]